MAYQTMRCYQHSNCEDRPAVAKCTKCGKALCRECTDRLRSEDTGDILCTDCLNAELASDVNWALYKKQQLKKEMIKIVVGFLIGLVAEITFLILGLCGNDWGMVLFGLSFLFFLPTLLASFGTIIKTVGDVFDNFILRIIFFLILVVGSPIMFIVRLVKRKKTRKLLQQFAIVQATKHEANERYAEIARQMNTRLESMEEYKRKIEVQYSAIYKNNIEERDKKINEMLAIHANAIKKQQELESELVKTAKERNEATRQLSEIKLSVEKNQKLTRKHGNSNDRSKTTVGSGNGRNAA